VGGFHSDFGDGVVKRLRLRSGGARVRTIRFVDASLYTEAELRSLRQDPVYGILADYLYYVNEPKVR
jgi:carotenoid cleavage dioxygenase-like enzyme